MGKKEGGKTEGIMEGWTEGGIRNREHLGKLWEGLEDSLGFWGVLEKSEKGREGGRRRSDSISGPLDVCGLGAVRLDLMEQEGREKGDGVPRVGGLKRPHSEVRGQNASKTLPLSKHASKTRTLKQKVVFEASKTCTLKQKVR